MNIISPAEVARLALSDTQAFLETVTVGAFFAHPDDTELEGGALLAGLGRIVPVHVLLATTGQAGIPEMEPERAGAIRWAEAQDASDVLGAASIEHLNEMDGEVQGGPRIEAQFVAWCGAHRITHVVTHHPACYNEDHRVVAATAHNAQRRAPLARPLVVSVDTLTGAKAGDPEAIVDVSPWTAQAIEAFGRHASQQGDGRLEHGARTAAAVRGLQLDDFCSAGAGLWGAGVYPQRAVGDFVRLGQLAKLVHPRRAVQALTAHRSADEAEAMTPPRPPIAE